MPDNTFSLSRPLEIVILVLALIFGASVMMLFFTWLPTEGTTLGIDVLVGAFEGGTIHYAERFGLLNPPWSVLPMIPLGLLPRDAAWGLQVFVLLVILLLCVPRSEKRWQFSLQTLIIVTAFPTLRIMVDGQLEFLIIAGTLLIWVSYDRQMPLLMAIGVLLATAKPQAVYIMMFILALFILQEWSFSRWFTMGLLVLSVVGLTLLWKGHAWWVAINNFAFNNTLIDSSLNGAFARLGLPFTVFLMAWVILLGLTIALIYRSERTLSREKLAFLLTASMLLAPYTGGNGVLVPLAIGILPLMYKRLGLSVGALLLINLGYLLNQAVFVPIFSILCDSHIALSMVNICMAHLRY